MEMIDKVKAFVEKYGSTNQELVEALGLNPEDDNGEYLVNMGYRWLMHPYEQWVHRDSPSSPDEEEVFDYINQNLVC